MTEPDRSVASLDPGRWRRRVRTVPMVLSIAAVVLPAAPLLVGVLAVSDRLRGRTELPRARSAVFVVRYLVNDALEIVVSPALAVLTRVDADRERSMARYRRVQRWSARSLERAADRHLGIRLDPTFDLPATPGTGPLIVLARHVSLLDASVPQVLLDRLRGDGGQPGWSVRNVALAEALDDPGFDLIYRPTGTVFIDRSDALTARRILATMTDCDGADDACVVFPEGRLFHPDRLAGALERLAERDPERAERLGGLRHVLPPRPGGFHALLAAMPMADVLVLTHVGFEAAFDLRVLLDDAPLDRTVSLAATRFPRAEIPTTPDGQTEWLDRLWSDIDEWIQVAAAGSPDADIDTTWPTHPARAS